MAFDDERTTSTARWWPALVFVIMSALLLLINWPRIAAMTYEWGDFAANSVLIQQAKHLRLLHGNYSRVGFYHPGPAILYVLAAGEALFHDTLGLVSPIGGQRIAVIFYTSAWVSLAFAMLVRLFGSGLDGAVATAGLLAGTGYFLPEVFTGLWFPDLYCLPFAAFCVALALAVRGDARHLPTLALCAGFLVNGHVSFVAITAVMVSIGLAANTVLARAGVIEASRTWWSREALRRHRRRIMASLALMGFFFVPLAVDAVLHYPGQVPAYLSYRSGNSGNSMPDSLGFVWSYLGPAPVAAAVVGAVLLLVAHVRGARLRAGSAASLLAVIVAAFLATLLYARLGIDNLSQLYVAYYFYTVPALVLGGAAVCIARALGPRARATFAVAAVILATAFAQWKAHEPLPYENSFTISYIPELYRRVKGLGTDLALDLDNSPEGNRWSLVWFSITGLQAYAARQGEHPFCIANNWHIVFSPGWRCSEPQFSAGRRLFVLANAPAPAGFNTVLEDHDLTFVDRRVLDGSIGRILRVIDNRELFTAGILAGGWSPVESASVWSNGPLAFLTVRVPAETRSLKLDLDAFTPGGHVQNVDVDIDGKRARSLVFDGTRGRRWEAFDLPDGAGEEHTVTLHLRDPISPKDAGVSADGRSLGVLLNAIAFE